MSGRILFMVCAVAVAGSESRCAERLYLSGWAEFGGVSRAVITQLPENQTWVVRSDFEIAGFRLERLDVARGRAWIKHGAELLNVPLASYAKSEDPLVGFLRTGELPPNYGGPWPSGYEPEFIRLHRFGRFDTSVINNESGLAAAGRYIGALRAYARTLPESERVAVNRELARHSAGALRSGSVDSENPEQDVVMDGGSSVLQFLPEAEANAVFIKQLLASAPPELGSLIGTGSDSEVPRLRRLLLIIDDPVIQLRLRQQLDGYAAPPIASYVRNLQGEWIDPGADQSGG